MGTAKGGIFFKSESCKISKNLNKIMEKFLQKNQKRGNTTGNRLKMNPIS